MGGAISDNLVLAFVIGAAFSWSKDSAGAAVSTGAVGYLVSTKAMVTINPEINMSMLAGITTSLVSGAVYNRWSDIKLPDFLNLFGGKHFVPIVVGFFCLALMAIFNHVWPPVQHAIHADDEWIVPTGALGPSIFGFINHLLIPTGLYQVLNTTAWLQTDEFVNVAGTVFRGDIGHFYVGGDTTGMFMSGFFPIMAFNPPGIALAMYFAIPKGHRSVVGGMSLSAAVTTFLTSMTGPLEFLFMFLVPLLYLLHTLLAGISLSVTALLSIHVGFSLSAGAIDYALMYNLPVVSQNVRMLLVMGVVPFAICFVTFSLVIHMFNLKTSGREDKEDGIVTEEANSNIEEDFNRLAANYIAAVGGIDNLKAIDACVIRLRLTVVDSTRTNDAMCKRLGASGVVKLNRQIIQVIVGAKAKPIGGAMKKVVARDPVAAVSVEATPATATPVTKPQVIPSAIFTAELVSPIIGDAVALDQVPDEALTSKAVGDGVAARPVDRIVVSPTAGTIVKISNISHVFCLETKKGTKIVVHMGIDTVALEGKGFKRLVEEGA